MEKEITGIRASASGKVLLTGGYLVLDEQYSGLVFATQARFHSTVASFGAPSSPGSAVVIVDAPQDSDQLREYRLQYDVNKPEVLSLSQISGSQNSFVKTTLQHTLSTMAPLIFPLSKFSEVLSKNLYISLLGDAEFYSKPEEGKRLGTGRKTGLGSSAGLVSSLVSALFAHFGLLPVPFRPSSRTEVSNHTMYVVAHNLAQFVHCAAQGKVGSGFDVSSCFFGTQLYNRFSPHIISPLLSTKVSPEKKQQQASVVDVVTSTSWNSKAQPTQLPPGFILMLGDVHATGTNTPNMVGAVLAWRVTSLREGEEVYRMINAGNETLHHSFSRLAELAAKNPSVYHAALLAFAKGVHQQGTKEEEAALVHREIDNTRGGCKGFRTGLKLLGTRAGVQIEPESQTALLDFTMSVPGVLCAGVPGAGGMDAVYAVLVDHPPLIKQLEKEWQARGVSGVMLPQAQPPHVILSKVTLTPAGGSPSPRL